jgi:RimJ/RimL family protein N-acetyltransferase
MNDQKPPLQTTRLLLRDYSSDDWSFVQLYACDPEVVRYMEWGPNTDEDTRLFVEKCISMSKTIPRFGFELAITLIGENTPIGTVSIHISNAHNREGWIGYCLNKQFWGKGFATEAATAVMEFGFSTLGLHRIFATCDPKNIASANILKKLGMNLEGHFRDHKLVRGKWRDTALYAILESD